MYISTPPSTEVENFQIKIYYLSRGLYSESAEPEADMLPSEQVRRISFMIICIQFTMNMM